MKVESFIYTTDFLYTVSTLHYLLFLVLRKDKLATVGLYAARIGFLINLARGRYDTALVFVAVFTLVALALAFYALVVALERHFLKWHSSQTNRVRCQ